jgi:D-alanyl-lipoteichoic acid acyltransferase DltB (MBOAT superfamily)
MAVGLGRLTGIELPENFRSPYAAGSVTEFWRRWHMTLSAWLRDYIYIPLGGNRRGRLHTCLNLLATMAFGGLWHGAKMTFVLWGLMHGLLLCIEKATEGLRERMRARAFGRVIMTLVTFQLVTLLWVLFRAASLRLSAALLLRIATDFQLETVLPVLRARVSFLVVLLVGAVLSVTPREHIDAWSRRFSEAPLWVKAATMLAVVQGALELRSADLQPFIYFQF